MTTFYVKCGKKFRCPDCLDTWTHCVLAKDHVGTCSPRIDTPEEVEDAGTWRHLSDPHVMAMADRNHTPNEASAYCSTCGLSWPCETRQRLSEMKP